MRETTTMRERTTILWSIANNNAIKNNVEKKLSDWFKEQLMVPIDFHNIEKILWKSKGTINCLVTHILQEIFINGRKKTNTGLEQLEGDILHTHTHTNIYVTSHWEWMGA